MDGDGHIVEVNAATEATFGYAAEEMVGRELAELMIPPGPARRPPARPAALHETGRRAMIAIRSSSRRCAPTAAVPRSSSPSRAPTSPARRSSAATCETSPSAAAEQALRRLAEEQAALRRVATAVASETEPGRCSASSPRRSRGCSARRRRTCCASRTTAPRRRGGWNDGQVAAFRSARQCGSTPPRRRAGC